VGIFAAGCPTGAEEDDDATGPDDDVFDDDTDAGDDDSGDVGDDDTEQNCSDAVLCEGNYYIQTGEDLDAIWLCRRIGGHLSIDSVTGTTGWIEAIDLPCLESVDGGLSIDTNESLASLAGLSHLETVGEYLDIHQNPALADVVMPNLTHVGDWLVICDNECLVQADAEAFVDTLEIWGEVAVYNNDGPCE